MFVARGLLAEPDRPKRYLKFKTLKQKCLVRKFCPSQTHYCFPSNEEMIRSCSVLESRIIILSTDILTCEADNAAVLKLTTLLL
jgi:hypothetical protein